MSCDRRGGSVVWLWVAMPSVLMSSDASAFQYDTDGCGFRPSIQYHRPLVPHCSDPTVNTVKSLITGNHAAIAERSWRQYQRLLYPSSHPVIWIRRDGVCTFTNRVYQDNAWWYTNAQDGVNVATMADDAFLNGAAHIMTRCDLGLSNLQSATHAVDVEASTHPGLTKIARTSCALPSVTQEGTMVHELGHGYGFWHFDDWLSTMNTFNWDVGTCVYDGSLPQAFRRPQKPSSDTIQQVLDLYTGTTHWDVGGTTVVQQCALTTFGCATSVGISVVLPVNAGWMNGTIRFTSQNLREAWPSPSIPLKIWLSKGSRLSATSIPVKSFSVGPSFAGAIYPYLINFQFDASVLPVGEKYCVIVQWDPNNTVSEKDESDNELHTKQCYVRSGALSLGDFRSPKFLP